MDPLSIVAGVSGICAVTAKLISALSEFVDNVQEAPKEVRALSSDLAAFYNVFTRIRLAIEAPRVSPIPDGWKDEFETLTSDCLDTVKQTKKIVDEAVVTTTTSKAQQMWRTVKITFKTKKLEFLRHRLVSQIATVSLSLDCLDESRGQHIESRLEEIHERVKELITSRENVREILVVLDKDEDDIDQADYLLQDRTLRNRNGHGNSGSDDNIDSGPPEPAPQATLSVPLTDDLPQASPDEKEAVDSLCTQVWPISPNLIYQTTKGSRQSDTNLWMLLGVKATAVQFDLDGLFSMHLLSETGRCMKRYNLFDNNIAKITVQQSPQQNVVRGIVFPNCVEISPYSSVDEKSDVFLRFESACGKLRKKCKAQSFATDEDPDQEEFVLKLRTIVNLSRQAWRSHTIALAKITKNLSTSTEASIIASSWQKATFWAQFTEVLRRRNEKKTIQWYGLKALSKSSLPYWMIVIMSCYLTTLKLRTRHQKQQIQTLQERLRVEELQKIKEGISQGVSVLGTGLGFGARMLLGYWF
ncbi:hypothetical protein IQ07DRAFT_298088 [Pyrenochaeta sp. DS3sAY3a]|nr:hypothetical protein IQ07DRAFT_298088 [Pyrenochaeta sp. DS3sAY3a]